MHFSVSYVSDRSSATRKLSGDGLRFLEADFWPARNPSWPMISELFVVNRFSSQVFRHAV